MRVLICLLLGAPSPRPPLPFLFLIISFVLPVLHAASSKELAHQLANAGCGLLWGVSGTHFGQSLGDHGNAPQAVTERTYSHCETKLLDSFCSAFGQQEEWFSNAKEAG